MQFKKTLISTSISAAAISFMPALAHAQTQTISQLVSVPVILSAGENLSVTNTGQLSTSGTAVPLTGDTFGGVMIDTGGAINGGFNGIHVSDAQDTNGPATLGGGIVNAGTLTGAFEAIRVDSGGQINNGINNSGLVDSLGGSSAGILIFDGGLSGGLTNTGMIRGAAGIEMTGDWSGDLVNSGTIQADQEDFAAIDIFSTVDSGSLIGATFAGGIINQAGGSIRHAGFTAPNGDPLPAIWLNGVNLTQGITNQAGALISSQLGEAILLDSLISLNGVSFPRTVVNGINNAGTINNVSDGEAAIASYGAQITGGVVNSGVISGAQALRINGIRSEEVEGTDGTITETISQDITSGITGGITNTGTIRGNMLGANVGNIPLFSTSARDYGAISITHGASVDFIDNQVGGTITSIGVAPAITLGSTNDIANLCVVDSCTAPDLVVGIPLATVEPGSITGNLDNSGTISSTNSTAIFINNGQVGGAINNDGLIDGADGGIVVIGGSSVGAIINDGTITAPGPNGPIMNSAYAIDIQNASVNSITNGSAGTITGGVIFEDATVSTGFSNIGLIESAPNGGDAIVIRGSTNLPTILNGGSIIGEGGVIVEDGASVNTISNQGIITGSSGTAIAALNGSDIAIVQNLGTINGSVNFGSGGGVYFASGGTSGQINGATTLAIGGFSQMGTLSTINGDLSFSGQIFVDATAESGMGFTSNGELAVTGNADVSGSTVTVGVDGSSFVAEGDEFSFLNAGGTLTSDIGSADGFDVNDQSQVSVLSFTIEQRGNQLFAIAGASDFQAPIEDFLTDNNLLNKKEGQNVSRLAGALNNIPTADLPVNDDGLGLRSALGVLQGSGLTNERRFRAVKSLDPETVDASSAGAQAADIAAAATVGSRQTALRNEYGFSGATAGDPFSIHGFWIQGYDNETDQDVRDGVDGFDADTYGVALGIDTPISDSMTAGLALSYADTDVEGKEEANEMAIQSIRLAGYASYNAENYYVDGQIAYAMNDYETTRAIDSLLTGGTQRYARGDHDGDQYSLRVRSGYPMAFDSGWFLTPVAELNYTYLKEDSYTEKGVNNLGLEVSTDDVEVLVLGLGARLAYPITTRSEITWIPEFSLSYNYDLIGDEVEVDSNFIGVTGAGFITQGANTEQEMYKAALRLRAFSQGNLSFAGGFEYIAKQDYESQSIMATVRYDF